jgi:hypothetical protein
MRLARRGSSARKQLEALGIRIVRVALHARARSRLRGDDMRELQGRRRGAVARFAAAGRIAAVTSRIDARTVRVRIPVSELVERDIRRCSKSHRFVVTAYRAVAHAATCVASCRPSARRSPRLVQARRRKHCRPTANSFLGRDDEFSTRRPTPWRARGS